MDEQKIERELLNGFLCRRGLRTNFLARQLEISEAVLYGFKTGRRLLTRRQLQKLIGFIRDYDRKLGSIDEGGVG